MECVILGQRRLWKRSVFLYKLCEGNLQGWLLYWGLRKIYSYRRRFWKQASLSIGTPLGNMEGRGLVYQGLSEAGKRMLWKRSVSVYVGAS
jgi:hypothetical protein